MNPTPNQITECTDERQLRDWARKYCMGWNINQNRYSKEMAEYDPTSPTEKGKAQCWGLAVGYLCWPRLRNGKYVVFVNDKTEVEHQDPQITVVKAAILAALNGEEL